MINNTEKMRCYAELLQLSDDAIFIWRFDSGIEIWNHGAEEFYGFQEAEALGHNPHDLLQTCFPCSLTEIKSLLHQCQYWEGELVQRTKEGRTVTVFAKLQLMHDEDGTERAFEINRDITERKQTEKAIHRQAEMLDLSYEAIFSLDLDGAIISWNQGAQRLYGYSKEEAIGCVSHKLLKTKHPQEFDKIRTILVQNKTWTGELVHITKEGKKIVVESRHQLFKDEFGQQIILETNRDITERMRAEEALRETTNYLGKLIDYANAPIIVWDHHFKITRFNHAFEKLTGLKVNEVINQPLDILFPESSREALSAHIKDTSLTGEYWETVKVPILRTDGSIRTVLWNSANIHSQDGTNVVATIAQVLDITEGKLFEEALQVKQEELTSANEELQAQQEELNTTYQELQYQADEIRKHALAANQARDEAEQRAAVLDVTIASIAAGIMIFDPSGNIIRINEFANNFLGYSSEDNHLPYQERLKNLKLCKSDGIPYELAEQPLNRALRGEVIHNEEIMIAKVPEKPLWILASYAPIYAKKDNFIGVILIFNDITEQKRKTDDLLASEREFLRVTLNSLGEGVVAADQNEQVIFINEVAASLTGYSGNEAIGEPLNKVLYILDNNTGEPILVTPPQKQGNNSILVTRDLNEVPVSFNSAPIMSTENQIIGTVIVFQDITEKQNIEQELLKTAKLESLGILAGGVAHDFNNALAGILANVQLAAIKLKKSQDISKYLTNTVEITRKASELSKQLLTFAKGGDPIKKTTSIIEVVKKTVQFALSGSKIKAKYNLPEDLWLVDIDEGQISQVINNLTINAEQAMPTGGNLEIYGENVVFDTEGKYTTGLYVKLTVKDHGIGMPAEIINKIFDPFFTTKKTGNGLGLSTSYSIIKKHNGYIEVESTPGIGTSFYIYLPVSMEAIPLKESKKEIAATGEAKILLMDDEDSIRSVGGEMLTSFGYRVALAKDGQEAVDLYKKAIEEGEPFDILIMDLTVPGGLGGIEAMTILRQINPEVKAIISSGYANDPVMADYEKYGFSGVVTKPYKFEELIEVLNKVLDKKQLPLNLSY